MKTRIEILTGAAALALAGTLNAPAGDLAEQARGILNEAKSSIITVTALSKLDMSGSGLPVQIGGLGEAQETGCPGLVLDEAGLTVVSYTALNPMEQMSKSIQIRMGDDDGSSIKMKSELSRIRMRLDDGSEVPARVVLKDKELDLAFLVPDPKEGDKKPAFKPVKLSADVSARELDEIVAVTRHGEQFGSQPVVELGRITSVIAKPRPMYDLSVHRPMGTAIFLPGGQCLGLVVAMGQEGGGLINIGGMEMLVLPASDIVKAADKAREAAAKKSETD
jgi:hypothetical protein